MFQCKQRKDSCKYVSLSSSTGTLAVCCVWLCIIAVNEWKMDKEHSRNRDHILEMPAIFSILEVMLKATLTTQLGLIIALVL